MTDKKTEALKLALEALENSRSLEPVDVQWVKGKRHTAITAIREALEDHTEQHLEMVAKKQEPVAVYVGETWCGSVVRLYEDLPLETHLYTSPPASKPLSGYINAAGINANDSPHIVVEKLERAIEAANGITGETK